MATVGRLPGPMIAEWDWQRYGACRGRGTAQFFHPDGERGVSRSRREAAAKRLCRSCPVRPECAAHALTVREPYGVWGGFTESERAALLADGPATPVDRGTGRVDIGRLERWLRSARALTRAPKPRQPPAAAGEPARRSAR